MGGTNSVGRFGLVWKAEDLDGVCYGNVDSGWVQGGMEIGSRANRLDASGDRYEREKWNFEM